jgi:hypothetical protein
MRNSAGRVMRKCRINETDDLLRRIVSIRLSRHNVSYKSRVGGAGLMLHRRTPKTTTTTPPRLSFHHLPHPQGCIKRYQNIFRHFLCRSRAHLVKRNSPKLGEFISVVSDTTTYYLLEQLIENEQKK